MSLWIQANPTSELWASSNEMELDDVMTSVYRQVLGNAHLIESDRLSTLESQLRNRDISVRQFVAAVALSDAYRQRFFDTNSQYRFIELNFKHLLGRRHATKPKSPSIQRSMLLEATRLRSFLI